MPCRGSLPALAFVLLIAGCGTEPPAAGPPPRAGSPAGDAGSAPAASEPRPEEARTGCSAAAVDDQLPAQPELPPAVAATRQAIFAAATACDLAALDELAPPELRYSFGDHGEAVAAWREAEARGEPVLRWMAAVLRATPANEHGLWVWPAFFTRTVAEWSAADRREAERLLGEDFAALIGSGAYLGHRVGIAEDGTWTYFVAGD